MRMLQHTSHQIDNYHQHLDGLGGWLIFLAIFLLLSPIHITILLISTTSDILPLWVPLTTPESLYYIPGLKPLIMMELIGNLLFIALFIYGIYCFFTKNRRFAKLIIWILIGNLIFLILDHFFANIVMQDYLAVNDPEGFRDIVISIIRCLIWIPYLLKSKRVRSTFRHG